MHDARAPLGDDEQRELERYRAALARAVEHSSLRATARAVGMSPAGLSRLLRGASMYGKTRDRLRVWYATATQPEAAEMPEALALALLRRAVENVPDRHRAAAQLELLEAVADIHRRYRARRPRWLARVRRVLEARQA
jgi:hypothetical protein